MRRLPSRAVVLATAACASLPGLSSWIVPCGARLVDCIRGTLASSRESSIVIAHGGRLWATPNEPRGAVFQFALPVVESGTYPRA